MKEPTTLLDEIVNAETIVNLTALSEEIRQISKIKNQSPIAFVLTLAFKIHWIELEIVQLKEDMKKLNE